MQRVGLLGAILTGFGLRLYQLGAESLWYDETVSVVLARKSLAGLIAHTAGDIHPPGYYILLHFWQALTQPSLTHGLEFLFAWPSLCFGVLILALIYALGRRLLNAQAALLAVWLGVVNPFHIWYSQEVRMYTLGAALGLICLWAVLAYWQSGRVSEETAGWETHRKSVPPHFRNTALVIYACAAAAGLYTLYYFLFTIVACNLIALWLVWQQARTLSSILRKLRGWILAQLGVLLLWSPWLPIFYRQAVDPPVPPWRIPWHSLADFIDSAAEGALALFLGQSFFNAHAWLWIAAGAIMLFLFYGYLRSNSASRGAGITICLYLFAPIALIYVLTATLTPLYHVRYLFMYAPIFLLLLAAAILALRRIHWSAAALISLLYVGASLFSLQRFWFDSAYRTDDHRSAVGQLAENWRPGDAILVNAGWVYTVLETYWPAQPPVHVQWADPASSLPPPLGAPKRLAAFVSSLPVAENDGAQTPFVIRTGSVDGGANLGWGNPASDFYPIALADTETAIANLTTQYPRIWHYRLYDTVNDPMGHIRALLEKNAILRSDTPYPGRDYLRVQLYESKARPALAQTEQFDFADALRLMAYDAPADLHAGHTAYVTLYWTSLPAANTLGVDLSISLRLYDADGQLLAQRDEAPGHPTSTWQPGQVVRQPLSIPVPLAAQPGTYTLELIVYRQDDGAPLSVPDNEHSVLSQRLRMASLRLEAADVMPYFGLPLATFDYIELRQSTVGHSEARAGDTFQLTLYWQPRPSAYTDSYNVVIDLLDADRIGRQTWSEPAGGAAFPSGIWQPGRPVRDVKRLQLEPNLPSGDYTLVLHLERASDGLRVDASRRWQPFGPTDVAIGSMRIR